RLVDELQGPTFAQVLERFYLPNGLTYAMLRHGLESGVLTQEQGRLRRAGAWTPLTFQRNPQTEADFAAALRAMEKPHYYQQADRYFTQPFASLVNRRGDLCADSSVLLVG